jgi:hypothetical protein
MKMRRATASPSQIAQTLALADWAARGGMGTCWPTATCLGPDAWRACVGVRDKVQNAMPSLRVSEVSRVMLGARI